MHLAFNKCSLQIDNDIIINIEIIIQCNKKEKKTDVGRQR